jgi:hypothetical protein
MQILKHSIQADIKIRQTDVQEESNLSKNIPFSVIINLKNNSLLPSPRTVISIEYSNAFAPDDKTYVHAEVPLKAHSEEILTFSAESQYCGTFIAKVSEIKIYDYLRYFHLNVFNPFIPKFLLKALKEKNFVFKSQPTDKAVIIPDVELLTNEIETVDIPRDSEIFSQYKKGDDASEIFDLRDYIPGDKINRIHWKLTSKQDKPIVKEYSLPVGCSYALIFDFNAENIRQTDTLAETLFTVSGHLAENEKAHKIFYYNSELTMFEECIVEKTDDIPAIMNDFMKLSNSVNISPRTLIENFRENNENELFSNILYIASEISAPTYEQLKDMQISHRCSALILAPADPPPVPDDENIRIITPDLVSASLEGFIF